LTRAHAIRYGDRVTEASTARGGGRPPAPLSEADALKALASAPTAMLSDALGRWGNMDPAIRPVAHGMRCFGPAFTVRCWPADNLTIHRAVELAARGDVLVIDGGLGRDTALLGDIIVYAAHLRGLAGIVLQGLVRDSAAIAAHGLPVFASGATARGPVKETLGAVQIPIQCGGVLVRPGDFVAGDDDGIVVVPGEQAAAVAERIRQIHEREEHVKKALAAGQTTVDLLGLRAKLPQ
jgi:4-hydroxy-4-methyl-2-oxoglutarate aldolase